MAAVLFIFPVVFLAVFFWSRFRERPEVLWYYLAPVLLIGGFVYLGLTGIWDPTGLIAMEPNTLNIFLAVVFITSPTIFRIVRGLTLDIKTRDYVAAAQTRGERPWYIMMWEILPNARGPLIVDACLRIGYTTILLGTLGFFGLGVSPESPDWGSTINEGRKLLRIYVHPALPPGARDHEPGARPEPARRRAARAVDEGLSHAAPRLAQDSYAYESTKCLEQSRKIVRANRSQPPLIRRGKAMPEPILEIENLSISFFTRAGEIPAVMNFSATVDARPGARPRRRVAAAASPPWRSGSCATSARTAASSAARCASRAATSSTCPTRSCAQIRGSEIAMIYQEPMASLNPAMKIDRQLMEVPMIHAGRQRGGRPAPRRCAWSRRCACPTPRASSTPTRTSSPAASSSASSSPWR